MSPLLSKSRSLISIPEPGVIVPITVPELASTIFICSLASWVITAKASAYGAESRLVTIAPANDEPVGNVVLGIFGPAAVGSNILNSLKSDEKSYSDVAGTGFDSHSSEFAIVAGLK